MAEGSSKRTAVLVGSTTLTNTVPNATVAHLRQATLTKGLWLICAYGYYTGGIGSNRASWYILSGSSTIVQTDNTGNYGGATSLSTLLYVPSQATIVFAAYQTSGSTQTTHGNSYLNCVRLD